MSNVFNPLALSGKKILVTGATSGIGRTAAFTFAAHGAQLVVTGRNEERLSSVMRDLPGVGHVAVALELTNADVVSDWLKSVATTHGILNGIFHSAGIELVRPARMIKQEHLDQIYSSSLNAAFGIARAASGKSCLADNGSIVFMSSVAGLTGQLGLTAYSAVKSGIDGMVRSLACELAPRGVRVNSIAAGAVKTEMHERITRGSGAEAASVYESSHLLGFGSPDDIANAALFLQTDAAKWITGTTMIVDGGYTVR